jgi:hypothetical protein
MGWPNFQVMRRTHATLTNALGISGKLVADQLGHSLDVNQNVYMAFMINETFDSYISSAEPYFYWEFLVNGTVA